MSDRLKATFRFLSETENEAAVEVLVAGLDCPHRIIRELSLGALLDRRSETGHREVFRRLPAMDENSREIVHQRSQRLVGAAADALRSKDRATCVSACNAVLSCRLYDALSTLVSVLVDTDNPHTKIVADTIFKLTDSLYAELSSGDGGAKLKDQKVVRRHVTTSLEEATRKFHRHKQLQVVEALLLVAKHTNAILRHLLGRPEESSHCAIVEVLSNSSQGGVIRLLLGFLEDPQMPRAVIKVLCGRTDPKFVEHLLRTIGPRPSRTVAAALSLMDSIAWAQPGHELLDQLSGEAQQGAVQMIASSAMDRKETLRAVGYLLLKGKPKGRQAAAKVLEQFEEPEASALAIKAINDEDPEVRAKLLVQLRPRKVPGSFSMLIRMVDCPHEPVRQALRQALPELTLLHFLENFDSMPESLQPLAGHLVAKLDPSAIDRVAEQMQSPSPVRRRRCLQAATAMGIIPELEERAINLLSDEDHMVRVAAAKALADCQTMPSWAALRDALLDRSVIVQEAAEESIQRICESMTQDAEEEKEEQLEVVTP